MQDFSRFSDDTFDVKEWINTAFKQQDASTNKEAYAAQLVVKLQMFIQEVNNSLEETSQQVMQSLPRVVRDAESLRQDAFLLKTQMKTVKEEISKVEYGAAQCLQDLLAVDAVKCRIHAASKALQEADNWKTLSADVESVFESGDITAISEKLVRMQESLKILVDIPDYKDRSQHLENLKNRLESILSTQLVAALNNQSIDATQSYVKIFRDINRLREMQKYYHMCQKNQLLQKWRDIVESDSEDTLMEWLTNYYDILLSTWHNQVKWCSHVLPDLPAIQMVCELFTDTLQNLSPSIPFCLNGILKQQPKPLLYLIDLKQVTERFSRSLESATQSHGKVSLTEDWVMNLAVSIYSSYRLYVNKYKEYEDKMLQAELESVQIQAGSITHCVRLFSEAIPKVVHFAEEANNRCFIFSNGCCYPDLCKALQTLFASFTHKVQRMINSWASAWKSEVKSDDWTTFQQLLHAVQAAGDLIIQMDNLDQTLWKSFAACVKKFNCVSSEEKKGVFPAPDILFLDSSRTEALRIFAQKFETDDFSFLLETKKDAYKLCDTLLNLALETVFSQIQKYLVSLSNMKVWTQECPSGALTTNLPAFGISPLEYITEIGQYLVTLPQYIEPFVTQDSLALKTAIKYSKLPYSLDKDLEDSDQTADILLGCVAAGTVEIYIESILKINQLTQSAAKQLSIDIDYLCNVLDDLGLHPAKDLTDLALLLKASPSEFKAVSAGKSSRLAKAVKNMGLVR